MTSQPSPVGNYLKELRRRKHRSLRAVQRETGASSSYLSQVEQGKRRPSADLLRKVASAYGASVKDLMTVAGYLNAPEVKMSDQERIEWAFKCAVTDPQYQFGTSLAASAELNLEAKRFIVEVYEKASGRKLI